MVAVGLGLAGASGLVATARSRPTSALTGYDASTASVPATGEALVGAVFVGATARAVPPLAAAPPLGSSIATSGLSTVAGARLQVAKASPGTRSPKGCPREVRRADEAPAAEAGS